ncbi:MAG: hypothetical protein QOI12_4540 [Alphaproteobacteria bacterium]|jgi:uncharacterized repeat protein (TIGR03809 family)|nr:hypothetical protein [Alphaproteobacteria bacterium]
MVDGQAYRQFCKTAEKWRELADRRREHFLDLYRTGRWKHYYSEGEFVLRMREVARIAELWAEIAPPPAALAAEPAPDVSPEQRKSAA